MKSKSNDKRVTIQQVAREAGVSPSTVSRVLTGNHSVSKRLRTAVLNTVERLSYRPNQVARSLKVRETRTLGLLINDILNPFYGAIAKGVQDVAQAGGYSVFFCNTNEDYQLERKALATLHDRAVDGIILAPVGVGSIQPLHNLLEAGMQLIQVDRQLPELKASAVLLDNVDAAYKATRHLIERGHRRIGLVNHIPGRITLMEREQGYVEAMEQGTSSGFAPSDVCHVAFDMSDLAKQVTRLIARPVPCTALLALNNCLGRDTLRAIKTLRLRIPQDIALVVFDDLELFELHTPPITTVAQPSYAMGYQAARQLLEQIASQAPAPIQRITLYSKLIVRESSKMESSLPFLVEAKCEKIFH